MMMSIPHNVFDSHVPLVTFSIIFARCRGQLLIHTCRWRTVAQCQGSEPAQTTSHELHENAHTECYLQYICKSSLTESIQIVSGECPMCKTTDRVIQPHQIAECGVTASAIKILQCAVTVFCFMVIYLVICIVPCMVVCSDRMKRRKEYGLLD